MSFRARSWLASHTYSHVDFPAERLAAERSQSVSVCLPARNEVSTIAAILASLLELRDRGVIDQVVVVDDSTDGTAEIARALGAEVFDQEKLAPELGPVLGKGDAMWRSLPTLTGDVVCFVDADTERFGAHFVCGLLGPLLCGPEGIALVKGLYRRPFQVGGVILPEGGGRVTELTARPLLNLFYPELAGVAQPLAGEVAARRDLLERLPFVTGYGVDIALLIDAYQAAGLDAIAQVDLGERQNAHQSLRELGPMAFSVLRALASRLQREGRLQGPLPTGFLMAGESDVGPAAEDVVERPPLVSLRAAA
jgi:glucosyl-3-phosphoglycerate synthase